MSNVSDCICVSSLSDGDLDTEKRRCLVVSVASIYSSSVEKRQKNCMQEPVRGTRGVLCGILACTTRGAAVSPTPGEVSMAAKSMGLFG